MTDQGVFCTRSNGFEHIASAMEDIWRFQQDSARIDKTAELCMGSPFNGVEGKYFKSLHAAAFPSGCDKGWTAEVVNNG